MLNKIDWPKGRSYRTGDEYEPIQFYLDGLNNSKRFDLLLGYFSSAAINVLSLGFARFIYEGGTLRIIANHILSRMDKVTLIRAEGLKHSTESPIDLENIGILKKTLDEYDLHFFECLAYLISVKKIDIKIVKSKGKGIVHYKSGLFDDGQQKVAFKASCNFTPFGLLENAEELDATLSWDNDLSFDKVIDQENYFERIFSGEADFVDYINAKDILEAIYNNFGDKSIGELLIQEKDLAEKKHIAFSNPKLKITIGLLEETLEKINKRPRFPHAKGPRQYQVEAYNSWVANDYRGLFAMATGTGKTLTSLNCILQEYLKNGFYKFIVLVPSISLANQWEEEIVEKFRFSNAIVCSSKRTSWQKELRMLGKNLFLNNDKNYAIILTYATFRSKNFKMIFDELFRNECTKITLIADEAHTMGAPGFRKQLPTYINARIGLSATPERQFDDIGEYEINTFFNTKPPKYTFVYNMKQAIDQGILCKYYYYPKIVALETEELNRYLEISRRLIKFFDASTGRYQDSDYVNLLLIQRKNIIHKAKDKIVALDKIVREIGVKNFKNAFIYVPEGNDLDYSEVDESENKDQDRINESLIDIYTTSLYQTFKLKLKKFTGKTLDRESIIELFKDGKVDALLAMKCLDEGIDIPQTQYAIFCSSTGNPRQFVQRRGRVLRKHDGKDSAIIYDMIVKPILDVTSTDDNLRKAEKNIFLSELKRFINFAVLSENKTESLADLQEIAYALNIDIYELELDEMKKYTVL